jgi:hypothetical protein
MDQLREYRLKMMEKRLQQQKEEQQSSSSSSSSSNKSEPITVPITKGDLRREYGQGVNKEKGPGDWFHSVTEDENKQQQTFPDSHNNTTTATLKLKSVDEELRERSEELDKLTDVLNPTTEKKKFKKRMEDERQEHLKKEKLEKKRQIELLRAQAQTGKKNNSTPWAFTKHIDSKNAAEIINRSPLTSSIVKSGQEADMIFAPNEEEPVTPTSTPCLVQIRMIEGILLRAKFQSEDKLRVLCEYIVQMATGKIPSENKHSFNEEDYLNGIRISTSFPRKTYQLSDLNTITLQKAELCPNGSIFVEKDEEGFKLEEEPQYTYKMIENLRTDAAWRLKGDDVIAKEKFKNKMKDEEIRRAQKEKAEKKKELELIRKRMEEDKKSRSETRYQPYSEPTTRPSTNSPVLSTRQHNQCTLQVRLPQAVETYLFDPSDTLGTVYKKLVQDQKIAAQSNISFIVPPREEYRHDRFGTTLYQALLSPKGVCIVKLHQQR